MSHFIYCYAECRYEECRYADCCGAVKMSASEEHTNLSINYRREKFYDGDLQIEFHKKSFFELLWRISRRPICN